jgi:hypothetical protein
LICWRGSGGGPLERREKSELEGGWNPAGIRLAPAIGCTTWAMIGSLRLVRNLEADAMKRKHPSADPHAANSLGAGALGAAALGTSAIGSAAIGALALGAIALGAVAIGRLMVRRARIRSLVIDELVIGRLRVLDPGRPGVPADEPTVIDAPVGKKWRRARRSRPGVASGLLP